MADYRKMYYVLCKAIDDVIDPLEGIPLARPYAQKLQKALLEAEEIYITTTPCAEETDDPKIIQIKTDE
ncbi:MAG: hypothetical protein II028_06610 [Clostridia bacterium]|nr:hypothetical protein [Clostridia bacterium]